MTRKEAITILNMVEAHGSLVVQAKDMAIKALNQEPCEDAISRADVKKYLSAPNENGDRVIYESDLDLLPPVTPQPKTGHWCRKTKVDAYDIAGVKTWGIKCQCDRCDFTIIVVEDFGYYKYCPNCGTKMESEDKK